MSVRMLSVSANLSARVHTKYEVQNGVAIIKLDSPNSKVNTLNAETMSEMKELIDTIGADPAVKAAVLISGRVLHVLLIYCEVK